MIGEVAGRPAATYSIGFEAEGYDEMQFARIAAKRFGTEHHEYYVTPDDLVRSIPAVAAHYDQPFGNSSALPAYYCAKMAREDGVTKLLAGDGGDELFGGNTRYAKQRVFGWYDGVPPGAAPGACWSRCWSARRWARCRWRARGAATSSRPRCRCPTACRCTTCCCAWARSTCSRPTSWRRWTRPTRCASSGACGSRCSDASPLNRMLAYDWRYTLAEADLPKVCGSTHLAGVAGGLPVPGPASGRLLAAAAHRVQAQGAEAALVLQGSAARLPARRDPDEEEAGLRAAVRGVGERGTTGCRRFATESLQSLAGRGIVRPAFIDTLLKEHLPAHPGYYGEMVWILMMLEQWLRAAPAEHPGLAVGRFDATPNREAKGARQHIHLPGRKSRERSRAPDGVRIGSAWMGRRRHLGAHPNGMRRRYLDAQPRLITSSRP